MKLNVTFGGAQKLDMKLKYIQRGLEEALETIASIGALPVLTEAQILAPVRTGNLRRSITWETTVRTPTRAVVSVGPHVDYAVYLEFGTRRMAPRPFLRPAFETKQQEALEGMKKAAADELIRAIQDARSR